MREGHMQKTVTEDMSEGHMQQTSVPLGCPVLAGADQGRRCAKASVRLFSLLLLAAHALILALVV